MGVFRVSKNQKSGKYHELPRKSKTNKKTNRWVVEVLGGKKIKSPGNVMNCPENQKQIKKKPVGGGSFRGSKNQKSGKFHELPRKSIHFF